MSPAVSRVGSGWGGADRVGRTPAIEALAPTMMSRAASEENNASRIAMAAVAKTPARIRDETEALRFFCTGVKYSLGSGSPSLSERNSGTEFSGPEPVRADCPNL